MYTKFSFIGVYLWNDIQGHIPINTSYAAFKSNTTNFFQDNNIFYKIKLICYDIYVHGISKFTSIYLNAITKICR